METRFIVCSNKIYVEVFWCGITGGRRVWRTESYQLICIWSTHFLLHCSTLCLLLHPPPQLHSLTKLAQSVNPSIQPLLQPVHNHSLLPVYIFSSSFYKEDPADSLIQQSYHLLLHNTPGHLARPPSLHQFHCKWHHNSCTLHNNTAPCSELSSLRGSSLDFLQTGPTTSQGTSKSFI